MAATRSRFTLVIVLLLAVSFAPLRPAPVQAGGASSPKPSRPRVDKVLLFAADGLRQDLVETFVDDGDLPALASLFNHGTVARHHGLRTQAPTNTGAGWYSLATGAWAGVHGSTNNTFHVNGFSPVCNPAIATGRLPQISGLKATFHCDGTTPVIDGVWKTPNGVGGPQIPVAPTDIVRLVTNDFMFTGGDGYTVLAAGTNVLQPGDALLDVVLDFITLNSTPPNTGVDAAVEGRIIRP